ncbi:MAG: hypothetical protein JST81_01755 [Bacteroidetes bacterium]|nr:hypothetical protein [Bacteroidota bacterium]
MKKCIGIIFSLYILFSAIVPCTFFDNCGEEHNTEQTPGKNQKKECDNCSPFCSCSTTYGFTLNIVHSLPTILIAYKPVVYPVYQCSPASAYTSGYFQPPRLG